MQQIRKHGGNLKEVGELFAIDEKSLLDFSANINPLGPPEVVYDVIKNNLDKISQYPDSRNLELKKVLAEHLKIPFENITLGNGASELIFLITNHLRPQNVWIPVPTFSEYEIAAKSSQANIVRLPLKGENWNYFDLDKLNNLTKNDVVFLCNPNNPTGQLYSQQLLNEIFEICLKKEVYLVIDESFLDFLEDFEEISFIKKSRNYNNLIILYSLTKFFAIPGIRLGAMITNCSLINSFEKAKDPWNINIFAQLAGAKALKDKDYIKKTLDFYQIERDFLYNELMKISGLFPLKPSANYILIKLLDPNTSTNIYNALVIQSIIVRNCNSYPLLGEEYIRVAIKKREDNLLLINKLKIIIKSK
ncbi:MAG: hypothetical protein JM58_19025 [Peptococcaceae bacterium BICA1-8]|nr:MAG: hypothetical protein JM58_19025 [Peptococcaceae bacterium BICA1-8]